MKRTSLIILLTFVFNSIFAQQPIDNSSLLKKGDYSFAKIKNNSEDKHFGKSVISDWYKPLDFVKADTIFAKQLQYKIGFIQHDSLAKIFYADGTSGTNQWLSAGAILDPKDSAILRSPNPSFMLSRYVGYTLDSIRFNYAYVRNIDSITISGGTKAVLTDTLFICYFKDKQIRKYTLNATGNKFALVDWKGDSIRMAYNYAAVDTIILTRNDSTGVANTDGKFENYFNLKTLVRKVPAGIASDAQNGANTNNLIGYTFIFKSGAPTITGADTAIMIFQKDPLLLPAGSHRANYFGFTYAIDTAVGSWKNPDFYNTSLLAPAWSAYKMYDGWYGYVAGTAFSHEMFIDAEFHLITDAIASTREMTDCNFILNGIYPNPAKSGNTTSLSFNLKSKTVIKIEVFNMLGQCIKTVVNKPYEAGENKVNIDLSGINAGICFVKVKTGDITQSKKLIIAE